MKFNKKLYAFAIGALSAGLLMAMPAKPGLRTVVQPDGSQIEIKVIGDEFLHFTTTADGLLIARDNDGFYRIAEIAPDGALISSGLAIGSPEGNVAAIHLEDLDTDEIFAKRNSKRKAPQSGLGLAMDSYPTLGSPKGLIILVEYEDVKFNSSYDAKDYFNDMINGENFTQFKGTGSALQFFTDQSRGKFTPSFDVYGPVTLPNKMSYYGGNDRYGDDKNPHLMVTHAIDILDADVDFSLYDTDKDGIIDNVYIIYAGQGEADYGDEDTVWPHSWNVTYAGINKRVDGKLIGPYACSNEWDKSSPNGIGTFVHEFSHVMGLPDLYHTQAIVYYTPMAYSVLDDGPYNNEGRTPPNYGAYERNALNWEEPIMLNHPMSVELGEISTGSFALIPTERDSEFFLLENRQQTGWDKYIPGHGLLIWHIDYNPSIFSNNVVNNTRTHQYVDIEEANGNPGERTQSGYTFPGTTGKTEFTSETSPALVSWSGNKINLPITNITEKDGMITFDVAGGGENAAVSGIDADEENVVYYNLQGLPVSNTEKGMILIEKRGEKTRKIRF